ncbi:hypothetical protein AVEN_145240-1, partial [Araneus ventricosus]
MLQIKITFLSSILRELQGNENFTSHHLCPVSAGWLTYELGRYLHSSNSISPADLKTYDENCSYRYEESTSTLVDPFSNRSFEADPEILGHPAYYTFQSELYARKWIACCRAALDCCRRMLSEPYLEEN